MSNTLTAQESSWHVSAEDTTMGATATATASVAPRHPHRLRVPHQPDADHDHDHRNRLRWWSHSAPLAARPPRFANSPRE